MKTIQVPDWGTIPVAWIANDEHQCYFLDEEYCPEDLVTLMNSPIADLWYAQDLQIYNTLLKHWPEYQQ